MRTVERRSCSATSPSPGIPMLVRSVRALANNDAGFLERAAANKFEWQGFADGFGAKLAVNVLEPSDRMAGERDKNVANDNAGLVRRTLGFNFEDDGRGVVVALQRFPKRIRQTHRLQADAKVAARNATFLQKRVYDTI